MKRYPSFREFYPFYLGEHANRRRLHFIGSCGVIVLAIIPGPIRKRRSANGVFQHFEDWNEGGRSTSCRVVFTARVPFSGHPSQN